MVVSVDTLRLRLIDYNINSDANLTIQPSEINYATGEAQINYLDTLKSIEGKKAFLNTNKFNFTLSNKGSFIQFSAPKVFYNNGSNELPINANQLKTALIEIQKELKINGINTNIFNSDLSRIDVFKGEKTRYLFTEYAPVFNLLQGKRQNKRDYGTTYLFSNGLRELCFYDKDLQQAIELQKKNITPSTNMRGEVRLLKKQSIKPTGLITANHLIQNYDAINDIYLKNIKNVFRTFIDKPENVKQLSLELITQNNIKTELLRLGNLKGGVGMKAIKDFILMYGFNTLIELTSIDNFINTCIEVTNYENPRVLKQRLQFFINQYMFTNKALPSKVKTLYNELYYKFAAA